MNMEKNLLQTKGPEVVQWMDQYLKGIRDLPVVPQVKPGEILSQLPPSPPEQAESFEAVFRDFESIILPGMTHWQHPSFFGYFSGNNSEPSILAEMLTATMGAQCMIWLTSPAAEELETRMMEWLRQLIGLPTSFTGVIQDTASSATLCALLTAREKATNFQTNEEGFSGHPRFTAYCSAQAHSSIDKAVRIAGIGSKNLRKIPVDATYAMIPEALEKAIAADIQAGNHPLFIVGAMGTTGTTAMDPLHPIGEIARKHGIWYHIDAAYAGTALLLPECRHLAHGVDLANSFVFNPHKWMFTNFDCSAYYVKDTQALRQTFSITPEYLRTREDERVNNYRDWGIQLGRRFRALKLWFVIRMFGADGLRDKIRLHNQLAAALAEDIDLHVDFERVAPVPINTVCFRLKPLGITEEATLNALNEKLLQALNATGKLFITHTVLQGRYILRMVIGQTEVQKEDVTAAWNLIQKTSQQLLTSN
jgi:aromatic-L-amino-acid/L-tryptophan decarboxylase